MWTLLKTQLYFLPLKPPPPPFPYARASNLEKIDANFSWEIVTSSVVLDHQEGSMYTFNQTKHIWEVWWLKRLEIKCFERAHFAEYRTEEVQGTLLPVHLRTVKVIFEI